MASDIIPEKYKRPVSACYYVTVSLAGLALVLLNLAALLSFASVYQGFVKPYDVSQFVMILSVSVAFMCVLLWFGTLLKTFKPDKQFATLIRRGLIVAIIGAVGLAIKRAFLP